MTKAIFAEHALIGDGFQEDVLIEINDGQIGEVQINATKTPSLFAVPSDCLVVPGFVDIHCHGFGPDSFDAGYESARRVALAQCASGSTSLLAGLISSDADDTGRAIATLAILADEGLIDGIFLEGPFISISRRGAHCERFLRPPDIGLLSYWLEESKRTLRMVTLAPELPGALEAIRFLVGEGVVAAIGHTDATYEETKAAIDAGATIATHLGNGMPPLFAREPGPLIALLESPKVSCELIADGRHLHPRLVQHFVDHAIVGIPIFVSDCLGVDGETEHAPLISGRRVRVDDGAVVFEDNGKLAGTVLPLSGILRSAVTVADIDLVVAINAVTFGPARAVGLVGRGKIEPGYRADLVMLQASSLDIVMVMRRGNWVAANLEYD